MDDQIMWDLSAIKKGCSILKCCSFFVCGEAAQWGYGEPLPMSRTRRKKYLPIQISIEAGYIPVVISL